MLDPKQTKLDPEPCNSSCLILVSVFPLQPRMYKKKEKCKEEKVMFIAPSIKLFKNQSEGGRMHYIPGLVDIKPGLHLIILYLFISGKIRK